MFGSSTPLREVVAFRAEGEFFVTLTPLPPPLASFTKKMAFKFTFRYPLFLTRKTNKLTIKEIERSK